MGVQTIRFKGEFDVSLIMNSIKLMRAELAKLGNSTLFGNLDKEISKIEGLGSTIQAQIGKGFASTKEFKAFEANISKLELEFQKLGLSFDAVNGDNLKNALRGLDKQVDNMRKKANEMAAAFKTSFSTETAGMGEKAKALTKDIAEMARSGKDFAEAQKKVTESYEILIQKAKELALLRKQDLEKAQNAVAEVGKSGFQKRQFTTKDGGAIDATQLAKINQIYQDVIKNASNSLKALSAFNAALEQAGIIAKNKSTIDSRVTNGYRAYTAEVKANAKAVNDANSLYEKALAKEQELVRELQQVSAALLRQKLEYELAAEAGRKYSAAEDVVNLKKELLKNTTNALSASINTLRNSLANETATLRQNAAATGESVKTTTNLNSSLDMLKTRVAYILSIGNAFYLVRRAITDTLNDVKNIDKAFASIAMVTDKTISGLWQHYGEYALMALKLGQSTESAIKASALFYQQGLKDAEVMLLTEETMKLATLAGLDFELATSQMTAALRGFHMEMDQGAHVTDVYSELAAHAAADVNGIAYAMSKTASIANNAGMSFENTAAFLTLMIETTQEAPENIGTAMKTIIARFTELKKNIAGTAESEFDDLEYNKVDKALKSVGVSLKDTNGQFRNLDDVFMELSEKWNTLDRNSQRYIATIAAGSRQQSRFIAMMEDYDRTMLLVNITENANNRANELFAKNAESLPFKIQELKTAWEQFRLSIADSSTFKGIIDSLTNIVNTLNTLDKKTLVTISLIGATAGKAIVLGFLKSIKEMAFALRESIAQSGELISREWNRALNKVRVLKGGTLIINNADLVQTKVLLKEIGLEESLINTKTAELVLNYVKLKNEIEQELLWLQNIYSKNGLLNAEELERYNRLQEQLRVLALQSLILKGMNVDMEKLNANTSLANIAGGYLRGSNVKALNAIIAGAKPIIGSAVSSALTTALVMGLSGADLKTTMKTAFTTALITAIPLVMKAVGPKLISAITTKVITPLIAAVGAIPLAIAAAVAAIGIGFLIFHKLRMKKIKEAHDAEINRLKEIEKKNKELSNEALSASTEVKNKTQEKETFVENKKRYDDLSKRTFLVSSEKEELQNLFNYFTENYSDVIDTTDENTMAIKFNTNAVEALTDSFDAEIKENLQKANLALNLLVENLLWQYKKINEIPDIVDDVIDIVTYGENGQLEDYYDWAIWANKDEETERYMLKSLSSLDSAILKDLGLEIEDLNNFKTFNKYLSESGLNLGTFNKKLKESISEHNTEEGLNGLLQKAAATAYRNMNVEGVDMNVVLADMFASTITEDDVTRKRIVTRGRESGAKLSNTGGRNHKKGGTYSKTWLDELATNGLYKLMYTGANSDEAEALNTEQWDYVKGVFLRRGTSVDDISDFVTSESNTNLVSWENLTKDFREYLEKERGLNSDSWDKYKDKAYDSVGYISDYIDWAIELDLNMLTAFTAEELEAEKEGLNKYNELYSTASELTQELYNKKLEEVLNGIDDEKIKNKLIEGENSFANSITKRFELVATDFTSLGLNPDDWKLMSLKALEGLVTRIKDISRKSTDAKEFAKIFQDLYDNYGEAAVKILSSIPIEEGFGIITEKSDEYILALVDAGYGLEDATQMFNDYLERAFNVLPTIGTSSGSGELFNTLIQKDVQGFKETNEVLLEAQKEFLENGKITSDTYFKMMEAGLDKYVKVSAQGYEFLADVADKYLTNDALGGLKALNDEISRLQKGLLLIDSARRATEGYDDDNWKNDKNLIKKYKDDKNTVENWLNAGLIDENTFNMVALAASKGYTSLKQLDDEAKAYLATISSSKEQVYILGLVTISETYSDLTEKVKELKDNIEDLTETVDKNKESLDEAEKKLYEAKHGTELFQSSLDGLINYSSLLEKVNNNIDNIKDGLSDISNLNDGKTLLESLSTNYNKKQANLSALNIVIDDALNNLRDTLLSNYGQFIKFNGDLALIDFNYLNMDANDELRKAFEKEYSTYEDYLKKKESNNKEIRTLNKEREKFEKEALNNYTDILKEVIDILKLQAQEEVDITKDKYDSLKDADDDYISALEEAILKLRELRDKEKSEEELAQKEKKLSLMLRDTSGANAKDVQKLQQEIEDDRQKLLDDNVDAIINNMKELYEKLAEARDAEIEYMESITENALYFNEWAQNIVASWENVEDMQDWFLSNNPDVLDMTVELTELYIQDVLDKWTDLVTYQSLKAIDFKANTEAIETEMTALYETTSENVSKVGTDIQQLAERNAAEAEKAAQKARDEAQKTYDDSLKKLQQAQDELRITEGQAVKTHQEAMNEMVTASEKGLKDVSTYATSMLLEWAGVDVHNPEEVNKWAKENHKGNGEGEIGSELYDVLQNQGVDMSNYNKGIDLYIVWFSPDAPGAPAQFVDSSINLAEAEAIKAEYDRTHTGGGTAILKVSLYGKHKYATGGLADYTGPAWVDGTPSRPEAFLDAEDTERFMTAAELFAMSPLLNSASAQNAVSSSVGDTSIEININVESISDDYDVDRLIKRVEDDINETARPVGTQVILNKRV